jgi:selenide,water dikinase
LGGLPAITDPNVLVGTKTADDAAVYRVSDELALIQTVDFFTPVVDDPYLFGAIAAANSLSDVYAMGGRPVMALNIVGFPRDNEAVPMSTLGTILRGGADKAKEAGINIVGGHSIDDNEPKYGLSVTGFVHPDQFWTNVGARAGDRLVLTKPLGIGVITTALRAGKAGEEIARDAIETMATLNRAAAEAAREVGVRACTDVTGFGLLGHLREMLDGVGARVRLSAVPILAGARELAAEEWVPGGSLRNKESLDRDVSYDQAIDELDRLLLCDAQTSGGLLFAVDSSNVAGLLSRLEAGGVAAAEIGEFGEAPEGKIEVMP